MESPPWFPSFNQETPSNYEAPFDALSSFSSWVSSDRGREGIHEFTVLFVHKDLSHFWLGEE